MYIPRSHDLPLAEPLVVQRSLSCPHTEPYNKHAIHGFSWRDPVRLELAALCGLNADWAIKFRTRYTKCAKIKTKQNNILILNRVCET